MIPTQQAHLVISANTHPGMRGKNNEDRYAASAYLTQTRPPVPVVLAVVADGVGGHRAGEVASEIAVETISQGVAESDGSQPIETLRRVITHASQVVLERSQSDLELNGMGSTCACCLVVGNRLYTANLGDSRIYMVRGDQIHQLSTDHTWIQEALDAGLITSEQAQGHPNMHIIRRHLGSVEPPDIDFRLRFPGREIDEAHPESSQGLELLPGDQLLLCSDGLTDLVQPNEIYAELTSQNEGDAIDRLINLANERGGHDNITIVRLQAPDPIPTVAAGQAKPKRVGAGCLIAMLLLILLGGFVVGAGWYTGFLQPVRNPAIATTSAPQATPVTTATETTVTPAITLAASATAPGPATTTTAPASTVIEAGPTITAWPTNTP